MRCLVKFKEVGLYSKRSGRVFYSLWPCYSLVEPSRIIPGKPQPVGVFWALMGIWGGDAQMGSGLDHETPFYLETGPITIYISSRDMRI